MAMAAVISGKQPAGTTYDQTWITLGVLEIKEDMKNSREKLICYEDKERIQVKIKNFQSSLGIAPVSC